MEIVHIFVAFFFTVYGGIYMDWDQVVLRSLDDLRNYDVTVVCIIASSQAKGSNSTPFLT